MTHSHTPHSTATDAAIERLLSASEPGSIVDGLFALAEDGVDAISDGWDRAVQSRLQGRLANRMKLAMSRRTA